MTSMTSRCCSHHHAFLRTAAVVACLQSVVRSDPMLRSKRLEEYFEETKEERERTTRLWEQEGLIDGSMVQGRDRRDLLFGGREPGWQYKSRDGPIMGRRHPDSPPIDYGGEHPYELMEEARKTKKELQQQQHHQRRVKEGGTFNDEWYETSWSLDESNGEDWYPDATEDDRYGWSNFKSIRIGTNYDGLPTDDPGGQRNRFVETVVMPAAIQFWTKALSVFPARSIRVNDEFCPNASERDRLEGFDDTDLILYVYAKMFCGCSNAGTCQMAGAASCDWDQYGKPIAGGIQFCYDAITLNSDGSASDETTFIAIETAIHEIAHVLGFVSSEMAFYYDRRTGQPRTPRPLEISENFECVTGTRNDVYRPSESTLRLGTTSSGINYYEVVTPTVAQVAKNHFNCSRMEGMRLENQPTNLQDCFGSHWEERLLWNELLTGLAETANIPQHLSPFTLALLEDTGWYQANYGMSRIVPFAHGAGCDFVEKECIEKPGNIPSYSEGYFCNNMDIATDFKCDPNHDIIAVCDLVEHSSAQPVPDEMQYFDNPSLGSVTIQPDYCPIYSQRGLSCKAPPTAPGFKDMLTSETFADSSKCFNSNYERPICLETLCNENERKIHVKMNDEITTCDNDGERIPIPGAEEFYFECPRFATICPELICPSNCAGKGKCNWDADPPSCRCFDESDTSAGCTGTVDGATPSITNQGTSPTTTPPPPAPPTVAKTDVEDFVQCKSWCGLISTPWRSDDPDDYPKCDWKFSCSACEECAEG